MSTPISEDPLYKIFEEKLHSGDYDQATKERFVYEIVELYWKDLVKSGNIPLGMQETLKADLAIDVHDMLKTKIYGHHTIKDYNTHRRQG